MERLKEALGGRGKRQGDVASRGARRSTSKKSLKSGRMENMEPGIRNRTRTSEELNIFLRVLLTIVAPVRFLILIRYIHFLIVTCCSTRAKFNVKEFHKQVNDATWDPILFRYVKFGKMKKKIILS